MVVSCSSHSPTAVVISDPEAVTAQAPAETSELLLSKQLPRTRGTKETDPQASSKFRVVFLADTHIIGPNYECCESNTLDTESIFLTRDRLLQARDAINLIRPRPDFAIVLGDVLHDAYFKDAPLDPDFYRNQETAFSVAADIFNGFAMPVYPILGNHDYKVPAIPQEFTDQLFRKFFGTEPYYSIDHKGWKFILANSEYGPTWDPESELYDRGVASYGSEQLAWIERELQQGLPTTLLFHYTLLPGVTSYDENPGGGLPGLISNYADTIKFTLCGHTHRWINFFNLFTVPHIIIGATRYDPDNFWLIEFDSQQGTYEILDYDKANWLTVEGDTWVYDGLPQPA